MSKSNEIQSESFFRRRTCPTVLSRYIAPLCLLIANLWIIYPQDNLADDVVKANAHGQVSGNTTLRTITVVEEGVTWHGDLKKGNPVALSENAQSPPPDCWRITFNVTSGTNRLSIWKRLGLGSTSIEFTHFKNPDSASQYKCEPK